MTPRRGLLMVVVLLAVLPWVVSAQEQPQAPAGYPGQSNTVPEGFPTPTTAFERLTPNDGPRDPGSLDWARPGEYIGANVINDLRSFSSQQYLATTYYFYWHDLTNPTSRSRFEGRFHIPPDPDHYSFLLPETHQREFDDMLAANLDFVLPVYWGEPGHPGRTTAQTAPHYWSTEGIPAMVDALDRNRALGAQPLQIGMFYDTTILANADLTTPAGKEYFYVNVRDFYSRIPPRYWAAIDDKPIVWLYDTVWVSRFDQSSIDYLSDRFAQDFGGLRLYVVRESQWQGSKGVDPPAPVSSDGLYAWGAAPFGYNDSPELTVAEVGPGFKNTQYCTGGPEKNCFDVDREDGTRYERQLQQAAVSGRHLLAAETWNEFSEGTDIQETVEMGRQYIDLTRRYVEQFKAQH
ncbi:MAG: DUF5010 domain-containing protein [Chloroflexi bacterium]|nr:DUF5010 domain-containing protein [Chloroflexota bacterium]